MENKKNKARNYLYRYHGENNKLPLSTQEQVNYFKSNRVFNVKVVESVTNPHQPGAVLRKIYEWRNITEYGCFDVDSLINNRRIIDVGASKRLINETPEESGFTFDVVALRPITGFGDLVRKSQTPYNMRKKFKDQTLSQFFMNKNGQTRRDDLLLFTDSIYYIGDRELYDVCCKLEDGVVAVGALHVPKRTADTDGFLYCGGQVFGKVVRDDIAQSMIMAVEGNPEVYRHAIRFEKLLDHDIVEIPTPGQSSFKLFVCALERVDFGATIYTRFRIVRTPRSMFLPVAEAGSLFTNFNPDSRRQCIEGIQEYSPDTTIVEKDGSIKIESVQKEYVSKHICMLKGNGRNVAFKTIKDKIIGKSFKSYAPKRRNIYETITNYVDDVRTTFSKVESEVIDADFVMPLEAYNRVVKELLKAKEFNIDTIKSALFVSQVALPSVGMLDFCVPILASAMKEAYGIEQHLMSMLDSKLTKQVNAIKSGQDEIFSESLFTKVLRFAFGNNDCSFQ